MFNQQHPLTSMKIRNFSLLLLLLPVILSSQNIDIPSASVWAAETQTLLQFDPLCQSEQQLEAIPLKVEQEDAAAASATPFRDALIALIRSGKLAAFDRADYRRIPHARAMELFVQTDTTFIFDPETYEEELQITERDLLEECDQFLLRQRWVYEGENQLSCRAVAIAPYWKHSDYGKAAAPIWFELPPPKDRLNNPAHRRVKQAALLLYTLPVREYQELRGATSDLKERLITGFQANRFPGYRQDRSRIPAEEAAGIFSSTDTIFTIDPETYTESFELVEREYRAQDVTAFRLEQAWYLDPKRGRLQCELIRLAPSVPVVDEYGTLEYFRPLFYWRKP